MQGAQVGQYWQGRAAGDGIPVAECGAGGGGASGGGVGERLALRDVTFNMSRSRCGESGTASPQHPTSNSMQRRQLPIAGEGCSAVAQSLLASEGAIVNVTDRYVGTTDSLPFL